MQRGSALACAVVLSWSVWTGAAIRDTALDATQFNETRLPPWKLFPAARRAVEVLWRFRDEPPAPRRIHSMVRRECLRRAFLSSVRSRFSRSRMPASSSAWRACCTAVNAAHSALRRRSSRSASAEYDPCFHRARLLRSRPSGVRGPVLRPPCIRQHRFPLMAGARQG